jgi:quercetin dioxygenase-like cupin family protein
MKVMRGAERPTRRGAETYFTGHVLQDPIIEDADRARAVSVTFTPGARTFWHTHPLGQTIHVTSGVGRAQCVGGPVMEIHAGDTVAFMPGEKHWHGAAPDHAMTHIAIHEAKDGVTVDWLEAVADADYTAAATRG